MAAIDDLQLQNAKAYLLQTSTESNLNLYDHLSEVLMKLLEERPDNVVDIFENISKEVKRSKFHQKPDAGSGPILPAPEENTHVTLARTQVKLFATTQETEDGDVEPEPLQEGQLPDVAESMYFFEQTGVGLGREEGFRIMLALKRLAETEPVSTVRFWGKLFGISSNYYIAETEYKGGEGEEESADAAAEETTHDEDEDVEAKTAEQSNLPQYKAPPAIPKETIGSGVNKYTYYVCRAPGEAWVKLPHVTPAQIVAARHIRKFLTGKLDAKIVSYPPFPGNEANYLRSQISRISAATHVSPLGFYTFEEEEEEAEEPDSRDAFVVNPDFEGLSAPEMADQSLANWTHHAQYILPQGRCSWFNPTQNSGEQLSDNEDEEENEEPDDAEPESGPGLLTPLSEDADINGIPAWSVKIASGILPQYSCVGLRSNRWPGAFAYATGKKFGNVYIGYGQKYSVEPHTPLAPPVPQVEYAEGKEIHEATDPTVEEEEAAKAEGDEDGPGNESDGGSDDHESDEEDDD
eukprot:Opistho-2@3095